MRIIRAGDLQYNHFIDDKGQVWKRHHKRIDLPPVKMIEEIYGNERVITQDGQLIDLEENDNIGADIRDLKIEDIIPHPHGEVFASIDYGAILDVNGTVHSYDIFSDLNLHLDKTIDTDIQAVSLVDYNNHEMLIVMIPKDVKELRFYFISEYESNPIQSISFSEEIKSIEDSVIITHNGKIIEIVNDDHKISLREVTDFQGCLDILKQPAKWIGMEDDRWIWINREGILCITESGRTRIIPTSEKLTRIINASPKAIYVEDMNKKIHLLKEGKDIIIHLLTNVK